ncbi:MAG: hypothetical protein ACYC0D_10875 [Candidatus Humimicrobiaceae bacterium]
MGYAKRLGKLHKKNAFNMNIKATRPEQTYKYIIEFVLLILTLTTF